MEKTFSRSELGQRGQALVEYAAMITLIGAGLVVLLGFLGKATARAYDRTSSTLSLEAPHGYGAAPSGGHGSFSGSVRPIPVGPQPSPPSEPGDPAAPPDSTESPPDSVAAQVASQ